MKRLSGMDAAFLYAETPSAHMHTLKIAVMESAGETGHQAFRRLRRELLARVHLLPTFRLKVQTVPLGLNHPVWVVDSSFDINSHIRYDTLPSPGGKRELNRAIARIASVPLDRSRPLWEIWMVSPVGTSCLSLRFIMRWPTAWSPRSYSRG